MRHDGHLARTVSMTELPSAIVGAVLVVEFVVECVLVGAYAVEAAIVSVHALGFGTCGDDGLGLAFCTQEGVALYLAIHHLLVAGVDIDVGAVVDNNGRVGHRTDGRSVAQTAFVAGVGTVAVDESCHRIVAIGYHIAVGIDKGEFFRADDRLVDLHYVVVDHHDGVAAVHGIARSGVGAVGVLVASEVEAYIEEGHLVCTLY